MRSLDVAVIGAGTAGSAAAIFLARAGHRVTVYERVAHPSPVGAGITLQPTGLHVLARLGLYDAVVPRGSRIDRLLCETRHGKAITDLTYETVKPGLFGLGLHRGALFEALWAATLAEPNVTLRAGQEIVDLARAGDRRLFLVDPNRERHGPHELVVVADGARSQLRDDTSTSKRATPYPWGALWFVAKDRRAVAEPNLLHQVTDGNRRFVGFLPTGLGPKTEVGHTPSGAEGSGERLVSLFWSLRCDAMDAWRMRGLDAWKDEVRTLAPAAVPILDQIENPEQVLFAHYHDVVMHRWSTRNVVYLGDAAHATSPQLGQGCNLALWDAMTLAGALAEEERDLARAMEAYTRTRRDHLAFYQVATRWLTPFFQGDIAALGHLRDVVMPLCLKVPFTKRLMTLSMLGAMDGFFGRQLPLDLPAS